jgi:hypothetical protein
MNDDSLQLNPLDPEGNKRKIEALKQLLAANKGLPLEEELKDLLTNWGAGSFGRQMKVATRQLAVGIGLHIGIWVVGGFLFSPISGLALSTQ